MKKSEFNDLLDKYLKGVATEQESELLDAFFDSFSDREEKQVFLDAKKGSLKEEMWTEIQDEFYKFRSFQPPMHVVPANKSTRWPYTVAAAASLAIILISAYLLFNNSTGDEIKHDHTTITEVMKTVPQGQKITLRLTDGTVIKLNSGSRLIFPSKFSGEERRVTLEGEAWFEVAKDPEKPFYVETQHLTTKVLGTSFNVRSFPGEVTVTLIEGKVQVDQASNQMVLEPNEHLVYNPGTKALNKKTIDPSLLIGWKDGVLHFEQSSLSEIIPVLENWYGVTFEYENRKLGDSIVSSGTWHNQSLEQVLNSISFMMNEEIDFEIKGKNVVVKNLKP